MLTPIAVYLMLVRLGVAPVWALVGSAGVSVVVLTVGWVSTHTLSTLGLLVGVQFLLGVAIAFLTGDARFMLAKDYLVTLLVALAAAASLRWPRPFIARVRRDLSADPTRFDQPWVDSPAFRRVHRQLTSAWVVGLAGQAAVAILITLTEARARAVA